MAVDGDTLWTPIGVGPDIAPGAYSVTVNLLDAGGALLGSGQVALTVTATDFPVEYLQVDVGGPNGLQPPDKVQEELDIRASVFSRVTPTKLWSGPFILPVQGAPVTTAFGTARSYNGSPPTVHHSGTDFGVGLGTPVVASAAGRVAFAGMLTTRGLSVIIDHGLGVFTAYHHLSQTNVAEGQTVAQGQIVALSGMTGLATGPHLHWELIVGGQNVDPGVLDLRRCRPLACPHPHPRTSAPSSTRSPPYTVTRPGTGCRTTSTDRWTSSPGQFSCSTRTGRTLSAHSRRSAALGARAGGARIDAHGRAGSARSCQRHTDDQGAPAAGRREHHRPVRRSRGVVCASRRRAALASAGDARHRPGDRGRDRSLRGRSAPVRHRCLHAAVVSAHRDRAYRGYLRCVAAHVP